MESIGRWRYSLKTILDIKSTVVQPRGKQMKERIDDEILRYIRQVVMKAMDRIRNRMRGSDRLALAGAIASSAERKAETNLTKGVDREAEDLILDSLLKKLPKMKGVGTLAVFSEERG